jgi:hypothetical protein
MYVQLAQPGDYFGGKGEVEYNHPLRNEQYLFLYVEFIITSVNI